MTSDPAGLQLNCSLTVQNYPQSPRAQRVVLWLKLTEVEEDEFGLDGGTQFDDEGDGDVDHQQPQHHPLQLPHQAQPGGGAETHT